MTIDLRSDTVTKPSKEMLEFMMQANVGDDVLEHDPSVYKLEKKCAELFAHEDAIYCPSGTMTNQIAINVHTRPGDEVICHKHAHIYYYEGGGMMKNSGVSVCLLDGEQGLISAKDIEKNINENNPHRPRTSMVELENTSNKGGGAIYNINEIKAIREICNKNKLKLHLDGARLFNALIETKESTKNHGELFDSISVCFSKGLGAPVGSVLIGNKHFINEAKRVRKIFGGAMRQSGYLAAACLFALENNIKLLSNDHLRAKIIAETLEQQNFVKKILPVETNILIFELNETVTTADFINYLMDNQILCLSVGHQLIRFVTHLDFTDEMLNKVLNVLKNFKKN